MATAAPWTEKIPRPSESAASSTDSHTRWLPEGCHFFHTMNSSSDVAMAISACRGSFSAAGGVSPSSMSRRMPPPTAVVMPITATPNRSIPFFTASAAPETAKATAPINSK